MEAQTRAEDHQRRQPELEIPGGLHADAGRDPFVHPGNEVAAHLQKEERHRQHGGQHRGAPEGGEFALACLALAVHPGIGSLECGSTCLIASAAHGRFQGGGIHGATRMTHEGALGRQVHRGFQDSRHGLERPLGPADARGAGHPFNGKFRSLLGHGVPCTVDRRENRREIGLPGKAEIRAFGSKIDRGLGDSWYLGQGTLHTADTGRAGHSLDG